MKGVLKPPLWGGKRISPRHLAVATSMLQKLSAGDLEVVVYSVVCAFSRRPALRIERGLPDTAVAAVPAKSKHPSDQRLI